MKIVIFAGGSGRRLWPISRQKSPKQFEPILGKKSTVRLAVDRVIGKYGSENIFISTNVQYLDIIRRQLPELPESNFIGEPVRRDLAAAVGLAVTHLVARFSSDEPIAIMWGDNYMTEADTFRELLDTAENLLLEDRAKIVFMGETARFANNNLGWIGLGEKAGNLNGRSFYEFKSWVYRPSVEQCQEMFAKGSYVWNTGYFVTTLGFVSHAYATHQPEMWEQLQRVGRAIETEAYENILYDIYPQLLVDSFDDAIVKKTSLEEAVVLHGKMGWSDPGTLYALKEAINPNTAENVILGDVIATGSTDCLLYNYEPDKLMAVVGLEGMVVVNMEDAILVVHKDQIPLVKQMVDSLAESELEKYS
ncbi:MAG: sugar phosphate nucleotidyltransferase [Candidatus Promineifilaceae bacterium]